MRGEAALELPASHVTGRGRYGHGMTARATHLDNQNGVKMVLWLPCQRASEYFSLESKYLARWLLNGFDTKDNFDYSRSAKSYKYTEIVLIMNMGSS